MLAAHRTSRVRPPRGFTLVELMIVIVIIGVLVAMIMPAIAGAFRNARDAQVISEISNLSAAIASFKVSYGIEPPSRIELYETAAGWTGTSAITVNSRALIRRMWPQFDFTLARDINGDGDTNDTVRMNAGECLLFFLGGILDGDPACGYALKTANNIPETPPAASPSGFSKNPANPFARGGNREGPFFDFDISRLIDTDPPPPANVAKAYEYRDSMPGQSKPLLYFSSYEGQGYRMTGALMEISATQPVGTLTSVYMVSPTSPQKPQSFQIISPGADGDYGIGGLFRPSSAEADLPKTGVPATDRSAEWDNLTNFQNGRLLPR